jgi:thymidylate kinase
MSGFLIVCEGLDCSGKTTTINEILRKSKSCRFIYSKGIGSDTRIGKISRKFPSTLMFFIELTYFIFIKIRPNLKKGDIILQDRYDISIKSYVPVVNRFYNRLIIKFFNLFIIKPNAIVYFHLPLKNRIKRLKEKGAKYELILANNPSLIISREKEYIKWYNNFKGPKININTEKNNIEKASEILNNFIDSLYK